MTRPEDPPIVVKPHPRDKLGTVNESGIPDRWAWLGMMTFLTALVIGLAGVVVAGGTGDDIWFVLLAPLVGLAVVGALALFVIGWREAIREFRR